MRPLKPADNAAREVLPEGWKSIRLEKLVAEVQTGFACGERDPQGVIQLRMNNVDTRGGFVWDELIRVPAHAADVEQYQLQPGDVVFNNTNSVELVGKSACFAHYREPVVYSNHFTRIRTNHDVLLPAVLTAWLNLHWNLGVFANICNRWVGQSAVKANKLLALEIPLPPLPEQKRIAAILKKQMAAVERAKKAAEEGTEAALSLPAAILRKAFPPGKISSWPSVPVGDIAAIVSGIQKSPNRRPVEFHRPYLTVRNVQRGELDLSEVEHFEVTRAELERLRLQEGDLLIVEGNGSIKQIGRNAVFHEDGQEWIHQNHIIRVRLDPNKTSSEFLSLFLNSDAGIAQMIEKARTTSGLYTLSSGKVASLEVPHPRIEEQKAIVSEIREAQADSEKLINSVAAQSEAVQALPGALLLKAFGGKLKEQWESKDETTIEH